jgi:hypothetical protein
MALRRPAAAVPVNARPGVDSRAVNAAGRSALRERVAPGCQPATARPEPDRARDRSVPWLFVLIVIGAMAMAGVLIIMLARLVTLPAVAPSSAPGPAPLSRSRNPAPDETEAHDWVERADPTYAR